MLRLWSSTITLFVNALWSKRQTGADKTSMNHKIAWQGTRNKNPRRVSCWNLNRSFLRPGSRFFSLLLLSERRWLLESGVYRVTATLTRLSFRFIGMDGRHSRTLWPRRPSVLRKSCPAHHHLSLTNLPALPNAIPFQQWLQPLVLYQPQLDNTDNKTDK